MIIKFSQRELASKTNEIELSKFIVESNCIFIAKEIEVQEETKIIRVYGYRKGYYEANKGKSHLDLVLLEEDIKRIISKEITHAEEILELPVLDSWLIEILPCTVLGTSLILQIGKATSKRVTSRFLQDVQELLDNNMDYILEEIPQIKHISLAEVSEIMVVPEVLINSRLFNLKNSNKLFSRIIQIDIDFALPPYEKFRLISMADKISSKISEEISRYINNMLEYEGLIEYTSLSGRYEIVKDFFRN